MRRRERFISQEAYIVPDKCSKRGVSGENSSRKMRSGLIFERNCFIEPHSIPYSSEALRMRPHRKSGRGLGGGGTRFCHFGTSAPIVSSSSPLVDAQGWSFVVIAMAFRLRQP